MNFQFTGPRMKSSDVCSWCLEGFTRLEFISFHFNFGFSLVLHFCSFFCFFWSCAEKYGGFCFFYVAIGKPTTDGIKWNQNLLMSVAVSLVSDLGCLDRSRLSRFGLGRRKKRKMMEDDGR
jgi:hypothetical protein